MLEIIFFFYFYVAQPDITAPGVHILAATSPLDPLAESGFVMHSGTSMATPHVSGIVALLKALHPDWSPAAIKSALITTGGFHFFYLCEWGIVIFCALGIC